jgi:hypothetical protein
MRAYALVALILTLCGCMATQPAPMPPPTSKAPILSVASGERQKIDSIVALNPDCTSSGYVTVRITTPPAHGELTMERGLEYPTFPRKNQRYRCNIQKAPGIDIYYKSYPGYVGADTATIEWTSPTIPVVHPFTYTITVS